MTLADLRRVAALLPAGGGLTLPKDLLLELLAAEGAAASPPADLTTRELAERLHRAPSTVRGWVEEGRLPGAYKLNGRDWRVPAGAVESFLAGQRVRYVAQEPRDTPGTVPRVNLSAWRRERSARPAA
jgi:excisionase family DNA binding protein